MPNINDFPIGYAVDMTQQHINPYPALMQMLASEPVSWVDEVGMWYVTRRADVLRILADTETFTVVSDQSLMRQAVGYNMLTTDGAEQQRLRRPFNTSFAPRNIRADAEPAIEQLALDLIETFRHQHTVDLKAEYADIIAIRTIINSLGLEVDDDTKIRDWVSDFSQIMSNFRGDEQIIKQGRASVLAFSEYVQSHIDRLRKYPDESVLGRIIHAAQHQLTDTEIIDAVRVIIFGGVETTSALITNTLYWLLRYPEQLQAVRDDLIGRLPNAIEETLRYEPPVQTCTRHVLSDVEVSGVHLRAGDTLQCMLGAANRDPAHYANPSEFNVYRDNARDHLAFANGKHFCIGAGLARMEASIGLRVLLLRFPKLAMANPDTDKPEGYEFRSPHNLSIQLN